MNISFSLQSEPESEVRISLSSFSDSAIGDIRQSLGRTELVDITLERIKGDAPISPAVLYSVIDIITGFLQENPEVILYYYCDEINSVPGMRKTKSITPAQYRNRLFSLLYEQGKLRYPQLPVADHLITIETPEGKAYIHLIYFDSVKEKVNLIQQYLIDIANDMK